MKTQKTVYNKLSKIKKEELSTEKVELGSIDNARVIVSSITQTEQEFVKIAKNIESLKSEANNKVQILRNLLGNLKDVATRIKQAEEELGDGKLGSQFLDYQKDVESTIKSTISKYDI